jgi:hypothetical protein
VDSLNQPLFRAYGPAAGSLVDAVRTPERRWLTSTALRRGRPRREAPVVPPIPPANQSIEERVDWILTGAGFPPLLVEHGRVVLSGFVVTPERADSARLQWVGCREINSLPYRRTFLSVYVPLLQRAGLTVTDAADDGVPYLICRNTPSAS